jgi:hypothetical protein
MNAGGAFVLAGDSEPNGDPAARIAGRRIAS